MEAKAEAQQSQLPDAAAAPSQATAVASTPPESGASNEKAMLQDDLRCEVDLAQDGGAARCADLVGDISFILEDISLFLLVGTLLHGCRVSSYPIG